MDYNVTFCFSLFCFKQYPILCEKAIIVICHLRQPRSKLEGKVKTNKQEDATDDTQKVETIQYPKLLLMPVEGKNSRGKAKKQKTNKRMPITGLKGRDDKSYNILNCYSRRSREKTRGERLKAMK